MKNDRAIEWAIDALQERLDQLVGGDEYELTLEAIRTLQEMKKSL